MDFHDLRDQLVDNLRERVRRGELTERGLARMAGISQPHIHNVLKGKRVLSMGLCDEVLRNLRMDVLDLVRPEDMLEWQGDR